MGGATAGSPGADVPPAGLAAPCGPGRVIPTLQRDAVVRALGVSHFELGRLLRERIAPLPVSLNGAVLWHSDEVSAAVGKCQDKVTRWRSIRRRAPEVTA